MNKILLAVDGSPSAQHATQALIDSLKLYKELPEVHLVTVHRPVPNIGTGGGMIDREALNQHYKEENAAALAPSITLFKNANVAFEEHSLVGEIPQQIVNMARKLGCNSIVMGTRGHSAIGNLVLGSIATQVLHLAQVPVTLIH